MKKLKFIFDVFLVVFMPLIGYCIGFWLFIWEYFPSGGPSGLNTLSIAKTDENSR